MQYGYAVLSALSGPSGGFRILPAGAFRPDDGRPLPGAWKLSEQRGRALIAAASQRSMDYLIDYEHQSLTPGAVAPAAGWFKSLEWRADGLYVTDARWTGKAKQLIQDGEYRFISPVFTYDPVTLEVRDLQSVALTNNPALQSLTDLSRVAVNSANPPRPAPTADGTWTEKDQANFIHVFGEAPEAMVARDAQSRVAPSPPSGTSEEDWATLRHVFGDVLDGQ